jgi:hypothetical protein
MNKRTSRTASRSADTGRFVTRKYAQSHPKTTVNERIPLPKKHP